MQPGESFYAFNRRLRRETTEKLNETPIKLKPVSEKKKRRLNERKEKKKNNKRKRLDDDDERDFPTREAIPFGDVAQRPPKLTQLPQPKLHSMIRNSIDAEEKLSESQLLAQQRQLAIMKAKTQTAYKLAKQAKSKHKGLSDLKADSSRLPALGKEIANSIY